MSRSQSGGRDGLTVANEHCGAATVRQRLDGGAGGKAPVLILYLLLSEWFVKGMTAGAIEGRGQPPSRDASRASSASSTSETSA